MCSRDVDITLEEQQSICEVKSGVHETQHRLSKLEDIKGEAVSPARLGLSPRPLQRSRAKRQSYSLCLLRGCCALRGPIVHQ